MTPYLVQLFAVGILWVSFHCVGMCGPIVAGLNTAHVDGDERWPRIRQGTINILAYQAGRAVTYVILGALAGWIGGSVDGLVRGVGKVSALVTAVVLIGMAVSKLAPLGPTGADAAGGAVGSRLGGIARKLTRLLPGEGTARLALFGGVMGFLPCMLMFWVLGLAASTGNPMYGAGVMGGLIVMTTPVLVFAGTSPLVAKGAMREYGDTFSAVALLVSGIWLALVGVAANGWIEHFHFAFRLSGESFKVMLW